MEPLTEEKKHEEEKSSLHRDQSQSHLLRSRWPLLVLLISITSVLGGGYWWVFLHGRVTTDDAYIHADVASISSRVPGTVLHVRVDNDQRVKKGDVLVELDPQDYQISVALAEANSARMQADIKAADVTISKEEMGNASGIFNLLRNIGGSFGVAISTTILARRAQMHHSLLVEHITPYNLTFQEYYNRIQQWLAGQRPDLTLGHKPLAVIYQGILRQAEMLAFNDTFWLLACFTAALVPLILLFRRGKGDLRVGGLH